jgi:hypothetical protein
MRERIAAAETYHLLRYHDNRLDGELPVAVVEQVLQAGAEQVDDQDVVQALLAKVIDIRNPGCDMLASARWLEQVYASVSNCYCQATSTEKQ